MKVLLVSPKDPETVGELKYLSGGENTYTETLLSYPPTGVIYTHHLQAIKEGRIAYGYLYNPLNYLQKARILPPDGRIQTLVIKDHFDLVHSHGFSLKLDNYAGPVVLSDSSSNVFFLKGYLGWGERRIAYAYGIRKWLGRVLGIYDQNLNLKGAPLIVWSDFARELHKELGADPRQIVVVPPGIKGLAGTNVDTNRFNILFVGTWFKRKGGELLLKAYGKIKALYPRVTLTLVGELPKGLRLDPAIRHFNYLRREKLIREVFPRADVLVLVPAQAEGYGLVVVEAASLGIPAIVTRVGALTEIVENGESGLVISPNDPDELTQALKILIVNTRLRMRMGACARKKFREKFSVEKTNLKLVKIYQRALFPA